jgi:hypothetical protein
VADDVGDLLGYSDRFGNRTYVPRIAYDAQGNALGLVGGPDRGDPLAALGAEALRLTDGGLNLAGNSLTPLQAALARAGVYGGFVDKEMDKQLEFYEILAYPPVYFDPSAADDTGDGSAGRPYRDLTGARLIAGRRHLIKAGTTITTGAGNPWLSIPATGSANSPIIIGRYGDSHLANPIIDGSAATKVIRGTNGAKFWRVRDLEIVGPKSGSDRYAVSQNSTNASGDAVVTYGIVLARLKIHDVATDLATDCNGVKLYGADNLVLDCEIFDIADDAIWFHGYRTKIVGNTIYRVGQSGLSNGDCIQCGAKSDGSVIRLNNLDHFEGDFKQCIYFEQTVSVSDSVLIEDNYCVSADGTAGGASPITCGATNSIVRRNFCKGGFVGIILGVGSIAHNNVVVSTVGRGIECSSGAGVYHNTIIQTGSDTTQSWSVGIRAQSAAVGCVAQNNVLIGQYNGILTVSTGGVPNLVERNNAFAIRGVSDAKFRLDGVVVPPTSAVAGVWASFGASLGVDSNYRPLNTSPLRGGAVEVDGLDGLDKDRQKATPSIGAYF